jgi:tRNA(adenine34) deaminase
MIKKSDEYFMNKALDQAKIALLNNDWPIGAVVVLDGKIVSRGCNMVYSKNNKLEHAEMLALKKAQKTLIENKNKCTLYTTCEPCPMCFGAIILNRVRRLVYGIKENSGCTHLHEYLPDALKREQFKIDIVSGVLADECWELFIKGEPTKKMIKNNLIKEDYK